MKRKIDLIGALKDALQEDDFWASYLRDNLTDDTPERNLHVAIFREPFLQWIFEGKKTVESRFSKNEVAPYNCVECGDILLLKEVGGPLVGICRANGTWSYRLEPKTWGLIKDKFSEVIGEIDESFWDDRAAARYATLVSIDNVRRISSIPYPKSDRRGWVIEKTRFVQGTLDL